MVDFDVGGIEQCVVFFGCVCCEEYVVVWFCIDEFGEFGLFGFGQVFGGGVIQCVVFVEQDVGEVMCIVLFGLVLLCVELFVGL